MSDKKRVLILCSGNSARSQMAEGLLRHDGGEMFTVESAGVEASFVRPQAIAAMREIGVNIGDHRSKSVDEFTGQEFDYVITVCDNAKEHCPIFPGSPRRIHWSIDDPVVLGSEERQAANFRRARDELRSRLRDFIKSENDKSSFRSLVSMKKARLLKEAGPLVSRRRFYARLTEECSPGVPGAASASHRDALCVQFSTAQV